MDLLLNALKTLPEYESILKTLRKQKSVGVSGAAQINRSHLIAGLYRDLGRPMLVLCQDELACRRTQEELAAFTGVSYPILPGRVSLSAESPVLRTISQTWTMTTTISFREVTV